MAKTVSASQADKPLLAVLHGERRDPPPIWMMRQAGRYLPEYRAMRAAKGGFLDLVYDADAAAEITLQPLRRFPALDAAILFSDILIVPFAIGQNLSFVAGEGPRLAPKLPRSRHVAAGVLRNRSPQPAAHCQAAGNCACRIAAVAGRFADDLLLTVALIGPHPVTAGRFSTTRILHNLTRQLKGALSWRCSSANHWSEKEMRSPISTC